ncbi:CRISPR-associated endonuclease Cas1 [Streptomyces longisporoflavus]|uniref:type I-E CRISPR-associated endonuclease Cas1e n=1 Tax=Streptomyces longisporoflavus TaxID=28044 RepID=UPI00167E0F8D|nr:type I-E CRISPR-associated endonuclease Cas1e [Streptomyces longisporoflavus]GGV69279.1 CRISPR-associated endonuclease Cas1 [Streptomyces longisporoflavus]
MATVGKRGASTPRELTRIGDRLSFVYLERAVIHCADNAITAADGDGVRHLPSATIGTLLLGPGTKISQQAIRLLGESGTGIVWVGEHGVRYYAGGRSLSRSAALAEAQARLWANPRTRLDVARAMYALRFPDEDPAGCTRRMLLGMEGDRVKACYRTQAARTGIRWHRRHYTPGDFASGDAPNQALTAAGQCMYGIAQSVIAALGCIPGLGFVHSGHELSFALDIADLYKTDIGIPVAFEVAAQSEEDVGARVRRALRDRVHAAGLLERCVSDVKALLAPGAATSGQEEDDGPLRDRVTLQSDRGEELESGHNLGEGLIW